MVKRIKGIGRFIARWWLAFLGYAVTYVAPVVTLGFVVPYVKTGNAPSLTKIGAFMIFLLILVSVVTFFRWAKANLRNALQRRACQTVALAGLWGAVLGILRYLADFFTAAVHYWHLWIIFIAAGAIIYFIDAYVHEEG